MKRNQILFIVIAALSVAPPLGAADEIMLRGGKVLRGRITGETDDAYRIKLGANMYLSVEKSKVAAVTRDTPPPPAVPGPPAKKSPPAEPAKPEPTKPEPAKKDPPPPPVPAAPPAPPEAGEKKTIGKAVVTTLVETAVDRKLSATRIEWAATWDGAPATGGKAWKSLNVRSTVKVVQPPAVSAEQAASDAGHLTIISDAVAQFARSASNLAAPDEKTLRAQTDSLLATVRSRAAKKRAGFERRRSADRPFVPKKSAK